MYVYYSRLFSYIIYTTVLPLAADNYTINNYISTLVIIRSRILNNVSSPYFIDKARKEILVFCVYHTIVSSIMFHLKVFVCFVGIETKPCLNFNSKLKIISLFCLCGIEEKNSCLHQPCMNRTNNPHFLIFILCYVQYHHHFLCEYKCKCKWVKAVFQTYY